MLSSKNLNQNMLKLRYFFFKLPSSGEWGLRPQIPAILPTPTYSTATKRSNFVAHKKSILISKIWGNFRAPSLYNIVPSLHLVWRRHWSNPYPREKEWMFLGMQDFAQSDSVLPNKIY